jgi:glucokinase
MTLHGSSRSRRAGHGPAPLVGDLGGTHARFAVVGTTGCLQHLEVLTCAEYPRIEDAITAYLEKVGVGSIGEVCLAVAGPVDQDQVDLPNSHWAFSRLQLERTLGAPLRVINDFTAQALSIDMLRDDELLWFGAPRPLGGGVRGVVGPGTGLGVAIQMPSGEILPSEGGHVGFAPNGDHQIDLLRLLQSRFRRVSVERLASGPGLENLYWANRTLGLGEREGASLRHSAREVAEMAAEGDETALRSVHDFFDVLATFAGDLALMAWTSGGIYLSGGVLRRLMPFFDAERFRARFEDKGRFTHVLESVPLAWIGAEHPGLLGCSAALGGRTGGLRARP